MRRPIIVLGLLLLVAGCGAPRAIRAPGLTTEIRFETAADKRAAFAQGYAILQRGDHDLALAIFSALARSYPELADYHFYFIGVTQERLGHFDAAEAAFARVVNEYPQSVKVVPAALELGTLLVHSGRIDEGRLLLQRALAAPDAVIVQRAHVALAEADERRADILSAYTGFMTVRREAPASAAGRTAKEHVQTLRAQNPALVPTGGDRLEEARLLLAEHDYTAADAAAAEIIAQPEGTDPAQAVRVQADALYGTGKVESALTALYRITDRYPDSAAAPDAWFRMGTILWNRDRDAVALHAFEQLRRRYPYDEHAADALYAIGRIHEKAERNEAAIDTYSELARGFPRHKLAAEARWRIGWIHYMARNWSAAATTFARLAERATEQSYDAATYWQARALEHSGRSAPSHTLYRAILRRDPNGYYAMWAQRRLRGSEDAPLLTPANVVAANAPADPGPPPLTDPFHLPRWQELKAAGVFTLARAELAAFEHEHESDSAALQYVFRAYQTIDAYAAVVRLLRRLGDKIELPAAERSQLIYPLAFWATVQREAQGNMVNALLVEAVMRQESLFDPEARSSADARGLMQLLPATAERVATANAMRVDTAELTEPDINIALGVRYLRDLFGRFGGDPLKAVAAYNGGEAAVEKWQRQFGDLEPDEFVENITYRETRDYVKRVMANYRSYVHLYAAND
jgi:peptidoglycan lytic transglycosylase